jgi:hypothetical protein
MSHHGGLVWWQKAYFTVTAVFVMHVKRFRLVLSLSFTLAAICSTAWAADLVPSNVPARVFFSLRGGCSQALVDEINSAKTVVFVQAYSFTSVPIAKALLSRHTREG